VWFYPLDNVYRGFLKTSVSPDYMQLFQDPSAWSWSLSRINVFVIGANVPLKMPPGDVRTIVEFLHRHRILLALQTQGLEPVRGCGAGLEAYRPFTEFMAALQNIRHAGGQLSFISLDEPLWYAHSYTGKNACQTGIGEIAREIASRLRAARQVFPGVRIGDVEPINAFSDDDRQPILQAWYDAFRTASGENFAYLQADVIWNKPWQGALRESEQTTRGNQLEFGVIYDGDTTTADSRQWTMQALGRAHSVEALVRPDQVVFESWMVHPSRVLPETDPSSFTGLIRSYMESR
jgi:hypothetical protein